VGELGRRAGEDTLAAVLVDTGPVTREEGRVEDPGSVLLLVFAFRSSTALAYAYGMAVTGTITVTTLLFFYLVRTKWNVPLWAVIAGGSLLITIDLLFVAANLTKLTHGAWVPLLIALVAYTVLATWQHGRRIVTAKRERTEGSLPEFIGQLSAMRPPKVRTVPGTAVFLNRGKTTTPLALRANVVFNHVRHERVVILTIETEPAPRVPPAERTAVDDLGHPDDGITHVTARYGYVERPDVPGVLATLTPAQTEGALDLARATYFLSKIELVRGPEHTMALWRKRLFITTSYITDDAAEHFGLPHDRTVIMGSQIEV
jgi:KUP system potassium uptake protein